jgi:hypothetical protein
MFFITDLLHSIWAALIHMMVLIGMTGFIISYFIKNIPFVTQYNLPLRIGCCTLFIIGVFFEGAIHNENIWKERVLVLEEKVKVSQLQSDNANIELQKFLEDNSQRTKEVQIVIQDRIVKEIVKLDSVCIVPSEVISILNDAAENKK